MAKVAFLGLGVMGYPMAGHLSQNGHEVNIYNRTISKSEKWVNEYNGNFFNTPLKAAEGVDYVFACVGEDKDIRSITIGENGAFHSMKKDSIFVDHTTASADVARELDKMAKQRDLLFLDAPVSGGQAGAENGKLTIMCGGQEEAFNKTKELMSCYGAKVTLMGEAGSGQLTKMVNQICIAGLVQGLSEALNFGKNAGLDLEKVLNVISGGAAQSWQMENRGSTMIKNEFDFGFAVDWMRKDLKIAMDEAKNNGSLLPITEIVDKYYGEIQEMKGNRWDTSSLIKRFRK